jgi:hypothetical protein
MTRRALGVLSLGVACLAVSSDVGEMRVVFRCLVLTTDDCEAPVIARTSHDHPGVVVGAIRTPIPLGDDGQRDVPEPIPILRQSDSRHWLARSPPTFRGWVAAKPGPRPSRAISPDPEIGDSVWRI